MGRYIYKPILLKYSPGNEEEYKREYIKSIESGELLVDLSNYDLYVTEEGIELPIPSTKKIKDEIINFINNLDLNNRISLFEQNISKIETLKQKAQLLLSATEGFNRDLNIAKRQVQDHEVIFERINEKNIHYLGLLDSSFGEFPIGETNLTNENLRINSSLIDQIGNYNTRIQELIENFNEIVNDEKYYNYSYNNFSPRKIYDLGVAHTDYNKTLYKIYTEIVNYFNLARELVEKLKNPTGDITYTKNAQYNLKINYEYEIDNDKVVTKSYTKKVPKVETIYKNKYVEEVKTFQTRVYDYGYITLACVASSRNIGDMCREADTYFDKDSTTDWITDFNTKVNDTMTYKVLTNEDPSSFNRVEAWTFERLFYNGGRGDWGPESLNNFSGLNKNSRDGNYGYYHPFYNNKGTNVYRQTYGNQFWRFPGDGHIKINSKMKSLVATQNKETGIWIPNEAFQDSNGNYYFDTKSSKFIINVPANYRAFNNSASEAGNYFGNYYKRMTKYASLSFGVENSVAHPNSPYDSQGYFNTWRMVKVIYSKDTRVTKIIKKNVKQPETVTTYENVNYTEANVETNKKKVKGSLKFNYNMEESHTIEIPMTSSTPKFKNKN